MKNKLTDLCGRWLLQNYYINAFCEMDAEVGILGVGRWTRRFSSTTTATRWVVVRGVVSYERGTPVGCCFL